MDEQSSARVEAVQMQAEAFFETREAAEAWMKTPNIALGGHTPVMQCETEAGAQQVRRILNGLEWGGVV